MRAESTLPWALAGLAVGLLVSAVLLVGGVLDDDGGGDQERTEPTTAGSEVSDPEVAARFLDAWSRSRTGTYAVRSTFERELRDGRGFTSEGFLAQRPPERLQAQFGNAVGRVGGRLVTCSTGAEGVYRCAEGEPDATYAEEVEAELATLRSYVAGTNSLYRVESGDDGCFRLLERRRVPAPPYGSTAEFCFDADTGAPTLIRIERPEGTDTTRAVEVRDEVTDADLRPPEDGAANPDPPGPGS